MGERKREEAYDWKQAATGGPRAAEPQVPLTEAEAPSTISEASWVAETPAGVPPKRRPRRDQAGGPEP